MFVFLFLVSCYVVVSVSQCRLWVYQLVMLSASVYVLVVVIAVWHVVLLQWQTTLSLSVCWSINHCRVLWRLQSTHQHQRVYYTNTHNNTNMICKIRRELARSFSAYFDALHENAVKYSASTPSHTACMHGPGLKGRTILIRIITSAMTKVA